jgi:hypothetical protein
MVAISIGVLPHPKHSIPRRVGKLLGIDRGSINILPTTSNNVLLPLLIQFALNKSYDGGQFFSCLFNNSSSQFAHPTLGSNDWQSLNLVSFKPLERPNDRLNVNFGEVLG